MSDQLNQEPERRVPWQLWVAIVMLALEGIGNLFAIPDMPIAAYWLAAKVLFIFGFIHGWRLVYILFLIVAANHVLVFASTLPIASFLNLVLMLLVGSAYRHFFPSRPVQVHAT
jgi:hypothetical protein